MRKIKLTKTNDESNPHYYALGDVEWLVRPTKDNAGICYPKGDAVPRDKDGNPVNDDEEVIDYNFNDEPERHVRRSFDD